MPCRDAKSAAVSLSSVCRVERIGPYAVSGTDNGEVEPFELLGVEAEMAVKEREVDTLERHGQFRFERGEHMDSIKRPTSQSTYSRLSSNERSLAVEKR